MHYTGEVYRHPMESRTPLLEVTIGCSHNRCTFCTMYRNTPFTTSPVAHIVEDLQELRTSKKIIHRIYLVNADPFVLSTQKLVDIAKLIHEYLPQVTTITCYASIKNIKGKSLEELKLLRSHGYNDLHIGLETAYDPALTMMNKGFTSEEAYRELTKLRDAGFRYDALLMLGVAGRGKGEENRIATAKLLNAIPPYMISIMPTSVTPGSPLEELCDKGEYVEVTEGEMLLEEIALLESLEFTDCYFFGSHYFNIVSVSGMLDKKDEFIRHIRSEMEEYGTEVLSSVKPRGRL